MKNNILKALSNNIGFKILAVIFAFTLWLTVYNIEDPTKSKTVTINVTVANKEYIDSLGKYFEIKDGTNKVSFSVTAARSVLDKLDESDFAAVANMEQIVITEDGTEGIVPIDITCTANVNSNSVRLGSANKSLKLALEDLMTKQFVVTASAFGEVAEGYALGNVEVTAPNVLKVAGPKSIVEKIASVIATIDVSGMSESWTTYRSTPLLFDAEGKEVDATRLTFSDATVNVSAEILNVKEVPVVVNPSGKPAKGYEVTSVLVNPASIRLKGEKSVLNTINLISIPSEIISIAGAQSDVSATVDITEYIPSGVTLVSPEQAAVQITVGIGQNKEKDFNLETKNITVTGLPTGAKIQFELESVAVKISGVESDINQLGSTTLTATADVTGLKTGIHEVTVKLDIDESKFSYKTVTVKLFIEDGVETSTGNAGGSNGNSDASGNTGNADNAGATGGAENAGNQNGTTSPEEPSSEGSTQG